MNRPELEIVTDRSRINASLVHAILADTYWANSRTPEQTELCISNSTPFAVFDGDELIGFARVISDRIALAYLLDVYVVPSRRGAGIGTQLTNSILTHPFFATVQRWMLRTSDAQKLYSRFGFELVTPDDTLMVLDRAAEPDIG